MDILLLVSGGRESALAWKMAQSPFCEKLYIAPGNPGTAEVGENVPELKPMDFASVLDFCRDKSVGLLVVGNEDPLVGGIVDYFRAAGSELPIVGPDSKGAALEGSKDFAKRFMAEHGIPTARYRSFTAATAAEGREFLSELKPPFVLKADGLAAGKGVLIIDSLEEARAALDEMLAGKFGASSATVVIEEFLDGIECSVFVLSDGHGGYRILPVAKDYKRIGEGDTGLNTGGMGAVSPVVFADDVFMSKVEERIVRPTVEGLIADGIDYRGFIFLGLISVGGEPMVIEYNVRMGDPETEVVMPRLASDLVPLLAAAAAGDLADIPAEIDQRAAVTVMAVSGGYPESYPKGLEITGELHPADSIVFHAGTSRRAADNALVTSGGRVLAVTSRGANPAEALSQSYNALENIHFDGMYFRRDIGADLRRLEIKD